VCFARKKTQVRDRFQPLPPCTTGFEFLLQVNNIFFVLKNIKHIIHIPKETSVSPRSFHSDKKKPSAKKKRKRKPLDILRPWL